MSIPIRIHIVAVLLLGFAFSPQAAEPAQPITKKLIEFGWDEPDPAFMRKHIATMEQTPFDGTIFHVDARNPEGKTTGRFTWEAWSTRTFTEAELRHAVQDLQATPFNRFTHNFLRFNTTPAKIDWFDDHSAVLSNARLAAKTARDGKCPGILFDIEQYEGPLFNYSKQRDAATKSWDQYAAQVRQRGREVMTAFQESYPDLVVFLTFGHCLPAVQSGLKPEKLKDADYGLLAPFLDGMIEARKGKTKLVDGHELSYSYRDVAKYDAAMKLMRQDLLPIVGVDHQKYRDAYTFAFGIWLDHDWRNRGWNESDPSKNYFTPDTFGAAVRKALETSDEYVWIYTETPRWWSEDTGGRPVKLPPPYIEAVRKARVGFAKE